MEKEGACVPILLFDLPSECIAHVFSFLPYYVLNDTATVSKQWHDIVASDATWRPFWENALDESDRQLANMWWSHLPIRSRIRNLTGGWILSSAKSLPTHVFENMVRVFSNRKYKGLFIKCVRESDAFGNIPVGAIAADYTCDGRMFFIVSESASIAFSTKDGICEMRVIIEVFGDRQVHFFGDSTNIIQFMQYGKRLRTQMIGVSQSRPRH